MAPYKLLILISLTTYLSSLLLFGIEDLNILNYLVSVVLLSLVFGAIGEKAKLKLTNKINLLDVFKYKYLFLLMFAGASFTNIYQLLGSFDFNDPVKTKNIFTELAVENLNEGSPGMTLMYILGFVSVFISAKIHAKIGWNKYSTVVIVCLIIPSLLTFSRLQLVVNTALYFFSYVTFGKFHKSELQKILFKYGAALIIIFMAIMVLRTTESEANVITAFLYYIFGGFAALSINFKELLDIVHINGNTFYGINAWLFKIGIINELPALHLEFQKIGLGYTNVYTGYRHLIVDYGFYGSLLFIAAFSFISGIAYVNRNKDSMVPIIAMCSTYSTLIFYTSAFIDGRVIIGVLLSAVLLGLKR